MQQPLARRLFELISSMRFAVSLLTVIAIASIIGTVLTQNQPYSSYLNEFGPFWFPAFKALGLYAVYNSPWFIAILAFLVVSTSICVWTKAPWMLREMRKLHENVGERSLRRLPQHAEWLSTFEPEQAAQRAEAYLRQNGFVTRLRGADGRARIAAKKGSANRLGYVAAHVAIILICIGALLDSNVPLLLRLALGSKQPVSPDAVLSRVPPSARLGPGNLSFRGNTLIPEGGSSGSVVLNVRDGILVQELPFRIALKKFIIESYDTGQPKLFASDVVITDKRTGKSFATRIVVNHPLHYDGVSLYQASFGDGGSKLHLRAYRLRAPDAEAHAIDGSVGEALKFPYGKRTYSLELTNFRELNVEDMSDTDPSKAPKPGVLKRLFEQLGSGKEASGKRKLVNVGPSFTYKLRDAAGQAREYQNFMLPIRIDGRWMMLSGTRTDPNQPFRYLRLPLDENGSLDGFFRLRAALFDPKAREAVGRIFARDALHGPDVSQTMRERLAVSTAHSLETFAHNGYASVADFLERAVPKKDREQAADIYLRVLNGAAWEGWQYERAQAGLPRLEATPRRARFVQDALNAVSDSFHYGVPVYLQLASYDQIRASVFQATRSPGENIVYLGAGLLILGVFTLLFIRERRAWLVFTPGRGVVFGMTCNRKTLDFEREFERHRNALQGVLGDGKEKGDGTG